MKNKLAAVASGMLLSVCLMGCTPSEVRETQDAIDAIVGKEQGGDEIKPAEKEQIETREDDGNDKLTDEEIEESAVLVLYGQLKSYENNYKSFDTDSCRYEINKIEHDGDGGVEVYGRVAFYDKHGSAVKFGKDYIRNFTVHMTEWGVDAAWCEM
ncbi:hypothetical protein [Slackia piriformis]